MYTVVSSPHLHSEDTTASIMRDVAIALLPACVFGIYMFGLEALWVTLVSLVSCVAAEFVYEKLAKRPVTISDGSAVVTGLILAVNLPSTVPLWIPAVGGVFAIIVVKQLFGGMGKNFMNPALAARCFLLLSFGAQMTGFPELDMASGATPLAVMKTGGGYDLFQLLMGQHSGTIGETSVIAILLGAAYLIYKKVISIRIPAVYIASAGVFIAVLQLCNGGAVSLGYIVAQLMAGGLLLGAFFMATDYVTAPVTAKGQIIYGVLLGLLTAVFRVLGSSAEGVSFAIIAGNLFVPFIEKITVTRPFGMKEGVAK